MDTEAPDEEAKIEKGKQNLNLNNRDPRFATGPKSGAATTSESYQPKQDET